MKIGIIGAGRIGGNCAARAVKGGHEVMLSFARDESKLQALADELGEQASVGSAGEAAQFADVLILSVPWGVIPEALQEAGDLTGEDRRRHNEPVWFGTEAGAGPDGRVLQRRPNARFPVHKVVQHPDFGLPSRGCRAGW